MQLTFDVSGRINQPVEAVFETVINPDELSCFFTTGGAKGRIETGSTVYWSFRDFPGSFPVKIIKAEKNRQIILQWQANDSYETNIAPYHTTVTLNFTPTDDGRTLLVITEEGWQETDAGQKASYNNCMGWTQMICALKAYMEHDIDLSLGLNS